MVTMAELANNVRTCSRVLVLAEPFPGTVTQGVSRVFVRGLFSQYMPYFGQHAHDTVSSLLDCFFCTVKLHQANMR
jgi:hypothetical protein